MNTRFIGALGTWLASRHSILAWLLLGVLSCANRIQAQLQWEQIYPKSAVETMNDVAFDGARFLAAGTHGTIIESVDGTNWNTLITDQPFDLDHIVVGDDQVMALGSRNGVASQNRRDWFTQNYPDYISNLVDTVYGSDWFVSVGDNIVCGPWGRRLTVSGIFPTNRLLAVTFDTGLFISVGRGGQILYSTNGLHWNAAVHESSADLHDVTYGGDKFVTVGKNGTILLSENGHDWRPAQFTSSEDFTQVAYGNGLFVAASDKLIITSTDAEIWTEAPSNGMGAIKEIVYGKDRFLALAGDGFTFYASPNGIQWGKTIPTQISRLTGIVQDHAMNLLAIDPKGIVLTSTNSRLWRLHQTPELTGLKRMVYHGSAYLGLGTNGKIATSRFGTNWQVMEVSTNQIDLHAILPYSYQSQKIYAVGDTGKIFHAQGPTIYPLHTKWIEALSPTTNRLVDLAEYQRSIFAISETEIIKTTDGTNWTIAFNSTNSMKIRAIVSTFNRIVVVGEGDDQSGLIVTSSNGRDWVTIPLPEHPAFLDVAYGNNRFVAISSNRVHESFDGLSWTKGLQLGSGKLQTIDFLVGLPTRRPKSWNKFFILDDDGNIFWSTHSRPRLSVIAHPELNRIRIDMLGERGTSFRVLMSENLKDWTHFMQITHMINPEMSVELSTQNKPHKFFRIVRD